MNGRSTNTQGSREIRMSTEQPSGESRRKSRIGLWLFALAVLTLLGLAVGVGTWSARQDAAAEQRWQELTDSGLPRTAAELE